MSIVKKNKLLMVALDFPPCLSAGVQRTLKFCEYLPNYNWTPIVLTANSLVYNKVDKKSHLPDWLEKNTYRSFGFNSFKHFSINGKYILATALPDAYITWYWHSKFVGKRLIDNEKPDVIWSTHPCLTALKIAASLKKYSGLPWVADFRDPFKGNYKYSKTDNKPGKIIDIDTVHNADLLVFATKNMSELYKNSYPNIDHKKFVVIENGYNEEVFSLVEKDIKSIVSNTLDKKNTFYLLHSGEIYDNGRDPTTLFKALKIYNAVCKINDIKLKVVFRGAKFNQEIADTLTSMNIANTVEFLPSIDYVSSIKEMLKADALIVIQGEAFNAQIPGKVYEYLRAKKPVLAIVDNKGATADLLRNINHALIANIENENEIVKQLLEIKDTHVDKDFYYQEYSRQKRSEVLAGYLDKIVSN